jgi:hypothetical protein
MTTTEQYIAAADRAARYGVSETNPLTYDHASMLDAEWLSLYELQARKGKVTRLRLLTERGYPYYDISYCHGVLPDGTLVHVQMNELRLSRRSLKGSLIALAKEQGVFAKSLGLLDEGNWSILS